jgi:hypothetical protein
VPPPVPTKNEPPAAGVGPDNFGCGQGRSASSENAKEPWKLACATIHGSFRPNRGFCDIIAENALLTPKTSVHKPSLSDFIHCSVILRLRFLFRRLPRAFRMLCYLILRLCCLILSICFLFRCLGTSDSLKNPENRTLKTDVLDLKTGALTMKSDVPTLRTGAGGM